MTVAASVGSQARFSTAANGTAIASYVTIYDFLRESLQKKLTVLDPDAIRGSRAHPVERSTDGTYSVSGSVSFVPGPYMLGDPTHNGSGYSSSATSLLTYIMGGSPSTNVWSPTDTLPFFDVLIDRVYQRWVYGNCKVNKATFKAQASGLLNLDLDLIGETEAAPSATAFPSIAKSVDPPYTWQQCVITLNSVALVATEFELSIDNHLTSRFSNSQTATDVYPTDRTVTLSTKIPWTSDYATLYNQNTANAAAASAVFTNGSHVLTFTIGSLILPDNSPTVQSKGEVFLQLKGICKTTGSTPELTITNV